MFAFDDVQAFPSILVDTERLTFSYRISRAVTLVVTYKRVPGFSNPLSLSSVDLPHYQLCQCAIAFCFFVKFKKQVYPRKIIKTLLNISASNESLTLFIYVNNESSTKMVKLYLL